MKISKSAQEDLNWWSSNIFSLISPIHPPKIEHTVYSDASLEGWGAHLSGLATGGIWTDLERNSNDINAAKFALLCLCKNHNNSHIKLMMDNQTAV